MKPHPKHYGDGKLERKHDQQKSITISIVKSKEPKVLIGSNQKGMQSRDSAAFSESADVELPVYEVRSKLPYRICTKRGKPVFFPARGILP